MLVASMASLLLFLAAGDITLHLEADKTSVHAGELIVFKGVARAEAVTTLSRTFDLAIRGPDGTVYRRRFEERGAEVLKAGTDQRVFEMRKRIDPPQGSWDPQPPPLRDEGAWAAWFVVDDIRSNEVGWDVRPAKIVKVPAAAERKALERFCAMAPAYRGEDGDLVWAALADARNDGLAQHVLDLLERGPRTAASLYLMEALVYRAASSPEGRLGRLEYGIDGPYLPRLGRLSLEALEAREKGGDASNVLVIGIDAVLAWIHFHPEEKDARKRLADLARSYARAGAAPAAGRILLELGDLHAGMTVDEVIALLGEPYRRSDTGITWYVDTPRHVNPGLGASIENGKIVEFRLFLG